MDIVSITPALRLSQGEPSKPILSESMLYDIILTALLVFLNTDDVAMHIFLISAVVFLSSYTDVASRGITRIVMAHNNDNALNNNFPINILLLSEVQIKEKCKV